MTDLVLQKSLPPQRWGFLPTNQFWTHAVFSPLILIYCVGYIFFFALTEYIQFNWWQMGLGIFLFHEIWGGLIERYHRSSCVKQNKPLFVETIDVSDEFSNDDLEKFNIDIFGKWSDIVHDIFTLIFCLLFFYPGWITKTIAIILMIGQITIARIYMNRKRALEESK